MPKLSIKVPGKVILSGEHSVVYGHPALVMAVDRYIHLTVEYNKTINQTFFSNLLKELGAYRLPKLINTIKTHARINIKSTIPRGCGMGSSAALSAALVEAIIFLSGNKTLDPDLISQSAYLLEKQTHNNPSGVDNTIVVHGGLLSYQKKSEAEKIFEKISATPPLNNLYIAVTGKPRESTGDMVNYVANAYKNDSSRIKDILTSMGNLTKEWIDRVKNQQLNEMWFKTAILNNNKLLCDLGVVSSSTREIINQIENLGGAAKISGAGGRKDNSGIILIYHPDKRTITTFLEKKKLNYFPVKLNNQGIEIDHD